MLQRIARLAIRAPKRIIVIALLVMVATGIFGIPVTKSLSAGGFQDPTSESAKATKLLVDKFGQGDMELIISVTSEGGAQGPEARAVGTDIAGQLQASPHVVDVTSAWTAPAARRPGTGQQGRQDRTDRRGHHRRRERCAEVHERTHRTARSRSRRRHGARRRRSDDLRTDQRPERKRPVAHGIHRDSAQLPGAGVGVRWPAGSGAAVGRRRLCDLGFDGGAARDHLRHRRIDIRAQFERRHGSRAGHRLHAADRQPVSGRTGRRIGARRGVDPHHGDRRTDRALLGVDGRAVDGRDGASSRCTS